MGAGIVAGVAATVVDYHSEQCAPGHFLSAIAKFFDVQEIFVQLKQGGTRVELLLDSGRVGPHRAPYQGALRAAAVCSVSGPGGGPPPGARERL